MSVRAKFFIAEVTSTTYGKTEPINKVVLRAATSAGGNEEWSKATPVGTIEMTITNDAAFDQFKGHVGEDVDILFEFAAETPPQP